MALSKLIMKKEGLSDLPGFHCPTGYRLRHFEEDDERNWEDLIRHSFTRDVKFSEKIGDNVPHYHERLLFICKGNQPVATATAWERNSGEHSDWYLHMVGVRPEYSGMGLGYAVSLAALQKVRESGGESVLLETDDFRLPAITIYMKLGFQPLYTDESHPGRWERILQEEKR